MAKRIVNSIKEWLEELFDEEAYHSYFLVDVTHNDRDKSYRVYIDGDQGVNYKVCTAVSRFLESYLDEDPQIPSNYILEVSSPGATKPLKLPRQYTQHIGRELDVELNDGKSFIMLLEKIEEGQLFFKAGNKKPKKKKKVDLPEAIQCSFDQIKSAKVKLSFK